MMDKKLRDELEARLRRIRTQLAEWAETPREPLADVKRSVVAGDMEYLMRKVDECLVVVQAAP